MIGGIRVPSMIVFSYPSHTVKYIQCTPEISTWIFLLKGQNDWWDKTRRTTGHIGKTVR